MWRLWMLFVVFGCARAPEQRVDELGQLHVEGEHGDTNPRLRSDMHVHFEDLRHIGHLLRAGRLPEAKAVAFWLTRAIRDPRVHGPEHERMQTAARDLSTAPTLAAALRNQARIAVACGDCHARTGARGAFERNTIAPRDDQTSASQLRRHRWAADRVWDGVVGASEVQWRAGLEVFAHEMAVSRVREVATRALANPADDRAQHYGDLLVSCTSCHPATRDTKDLYEALRTQRARKLLHPLSWRPGIAASSGPSTMQRTHDD